MPAGSLDKTILHGQHELAAADLEMEAIRNPETKRLLRAMADQIRDPNLKLPPVPAKNTDQP